MWLKKLKIAVIEENIKSFEELLKDIPTLETKEEREEAIYLIEAVKKILQKNKIKVKASMDQMQKNINFLNSAVADKVSKFDIMS